MTARNVAYSIKMRETQYKLLMHWDRTPDKIVTWDKSRTSICTDIDVVYTRLRTKDLCLLVVKTASLTKEHHFSMVIANICVHPLYKEKRKTVEITGSVLIELKQDQRRSPIMLNDDFNMNLFSKPCFDDQVNEQDCA